MARISDNRIDVQKVLAEVADDSAGGTTVFIGTVRNNHRGLKVKALEYQVYSKMAEAKMKEIEREAKRRWPISHISIVHRKGRLGVGEVSVIIAVSAAHRADAFEASRFAIEALKRTVPIWKRESTPEGKTDWVKGSRIERLKVTAPRKVRGSGSPRQNPPASFA